MKSYIFINAIFIVKAFFIIKKKIKPKEKKTCVGGILQLI